jgi:phage terminase large subunit-like protein
MKRWKDLTIVQRRKRIKQLWVIEEWVEIGLLTIITGVCVWLLLR